MNDRAVGGDAATTELSGRGVDVRRRHRECEVLLRDVHLFLEHDHAASSRAHEDPRPARVAKADLQPEDVAIEELGGPEIPHLDRDFVHALDAQHHAPSSRDAPFASWDVHRHWTLLSQGRDTEAIVHGDGVDDAAIADHCG